MGSADDCWSGFSSAWLSEDGSGSNGSARGLGGYAKRADAGRQVLCGVPRVVTTEHDCRVYVVQDLCDEATGEKVGERWTYMGTAQDHEPSYAG